MNQLCLDEHYHHESAAQQQSSSSSLHKLTYTVLQIKMALVYVFYKQNNSLVSFHMFTVDDGTGVINCLCWKNDLLKDETDPGKCEFAYVG